MDVSLSYLVSASHTKSVSLNAPNGDDLYDKDDERPFITHFFSNLATRAVFELMANGSDTNQQQQLLFHSFGRAIDWVNKIYPLTRSFLTATGIAGGPTIEYRSAFWVDSSLEFEESYKKVIQEYQKSDVFDELDFGKRDQLLSEVNAWIEDNTKGLITDSVSSGEITNDTKLIIGATLYFDGEWSVPFIDAGYHVYRSQDGKKFSLPFMKSTQKEQYVQQFKNFKILSIPYKQNPASDFSMLFYLPDDPQEIPYLRDFLGKYESVIQQLYFPEKQQISDLLIPKFKLHYRSGFRNDTPLIFKRLVTTTVTTTGGSLDASVIIDERGTRAAGATAFPFDLSQETPPPSPPGTRQPSNMEEMEFLATRPFIFFVRDNKFGRMLFAGGLQTPPDQSP